MNKKAKAILMILVGILALTAITGYYFYNKGPVNVEKASAVKINASKLYNALATDSATALKLYAGKVIEISGVVHATLENQQEEMVVIIKTDTDGGYINCTMEEKGDVKSKGNVIIKGICSGIGQGDAEMGILETFI